MRLGGHADSIDKSDFGFAARKVVTHTPHRSRIGVVGVAQYDD
jgi:hypothetical protein